MAGLDNLTERVPLHKGVACVQFQFRGVERPDTADIVQQHIGAEIAAKASPDGYTLLMAIDGTLVMNPFLYSTLSYDPFKNFAPISLIARVPSVIEANLSVPASTMKELIDQERTKPG